MIITAKFNGICPACNLPTKKGHDIDYVNKKAFHPACVPAEPESEPVTPDAFALAERLGFIHWTDDMDSAGLLRSMHARDSGTSAGRCLAPTHGRSNGNLFES